ncbi:MAG: hypothetical protein ACTSWX_09375 [Promethearchaeota archaeon]
MIKIENSHDLPKTGFFFKNNSKLWSNLIGLILVFSCMFLFFGILSVDGNPFLAIYTFAKWSIFSNIFTYFILLSNAIPISIFLDNYSLQKELIKRRMNFAFFVSIIMFLIESSIALYNYYAHLIILRYVPSSMEWVLLGIVAVGAFIVAYLGNFLFIRGSCIEKIDSESGKISFFKKNKIVGSLILLIPIIFMISYITSIEFLEDIDKVFLIWLDAIYILVVGIIFWKFGYQWYKTNDLPIRDKNNLNFNGNIENDGTI